MAGNWVFPFQFKKHINFLKRTLKPGNGNNPLKLRENEFLITFDDALLGVYEYAYPLMEEYGLNGIIFVVVDFIGKKNLWDAHFLTPVYHMDKRQIVELSQRGWIIGSHGKTHRGFIFLNDKQIKYELEYSKKYLEDITGKEVIHFSYPFGIYDKRAEIFMEELGYKFAFSGISGNKRKLKPFKIPRIPIFITDIFLKPKLINFYKLIDFAFSLPSRLTPIYQKLFANYDVKIYS